MSTKGIAFAVAVAGVGRPNPDHSGGGPSGPVPGCRGGGDRRSSWSAGERRRRRVRHATAGRRAGDACPPREPLVRPSKGWRRQLRSRCTLGGLPSREVARSCGQVWRPLHGPAGAKTRGTNPGTTPSMNPSKPWNRALDAGNLEQPVGLSQQKRAIDPRALVRTHR